jgi:poly(3-hydroxybutyrate) depolymerase
MVTNFKISRISAVTAIAPLIMLAFQGAAQPQKRIINVAGEERSYYLFVPNSVTDATPAPLLVLLHGSGQVGRDLVRKWTDLASAEGFILIAPDAADTRYWQLNVDGPAYIRQVIDAVALTNAIDRRRIFLFGISGGAVYALTLAMLESEYFAAVAIFAGAWRDDRFYTVLPFVKRKIPVSIYVGDKDEFFPLKSVRNTVAALRDAGIPVTLEVLRGRNHSYPKVARLVNPRAWDLMKSVRLEFEPTFRSDE